MAPPTFTSAQVCTAAGITYRQLEHWTRLGLARPAGGGSPGRPYRYSARDLEQIRCVAALRAVGVEPSTLIPVLRVGGLVDALRDHARVLVDLADEVEPVITAA